jgi:hypothetical protein
MINQGGITITSGVTRNNILIAPELAFTLSCKVVNTGITADSDGKKIIKAGTPLIGDLKARDTAYVAGTVSDTSGIAGIIMHDLDVSGAAGTTRNATVVVSGYVDETKLDSSVVTIVDTAGVAAAMPRIVFVK